MPKPKTFKTNDDVPDNLRPYIYHGVDLKFSSNSKEAVGDCPWCGRENKFSVKTATGVWRCVVCSQGSNKGGGNKHTFLNMLFERSTETKPEAYDKLAEDRKVSADSLKKWGLRKSYTTDEWIIPTYNADGKLVNLYKYLFSKTSGRSMLLVTPTCGHQLFGRNMIKAAKPILVLCEGLWDSIALWEAMATHRDQEGVLHETSNVAGSLLSEIDVVGTPSASVFFENWVYSFRGKEIWLMAQNDHDRKDDKTGQLRESASYAGMRRVTNMLVAGGINPTDIFLLTWGDGEKLFDPKRKHGYDIRDLLNE